MTRNALALSALAFCVFVGLREPAWADAADVACTTGLLGACLDSLNSKLRGLIESFENSGKALEAGLGGQIATNIALARAQFGSELDKQIANARNEAQNFVASTVGQIHRLEAEAFKDAQKLTKDVLDTASMIPFTRRDPAVRPISNPYYAPREGQYLLRVDGHFVDAGRKGYEASVVVDKGGQKYTQSGNNTDELQFRIPYTALQRQGRNPNTVEYRHLTITVPYQGNEWWCLFDFMCKQTATFGLDLVTLPQSPGSISIKKRKTVPGVNTQPVTTPEQFQDSKDNDITEDKSGKLYCFAPRDAGTGWRIQSASVKGRITQVVEGDEGKDWWWVSNPDNSSNIANACVRMETLHKGWPNHSGKVKFVVDYTEEHDTLNNTESTVPVQITWGDSKVIQLDAGETWVGEFKQFDDKVYQFQDDNLGTPFLIVDPKPAAVTVSLVAQSQ